MISGIEIDLSLNVFLVSRVAEFDLIEEIGVPLGESAAAAGIIGSSRFKNPDTAQIQCFEGFRSGNETQFP